MRACCCAPHPDTRFGKKSGVLARLNLDDVEIVADHCHPHALLKVVDAVYTVSSQLGFEGLLLGKPGLLLRYAVLCRLGADP